MPKPPKPTGLKIETPIAQKNSPSTTFTYSPEEKETSLDDTHPIASSSLHIFFMTFFGAIAFILGALYFGARSGFLPIFTIIGGLIAVYYFRKLTQINKPPQ